MLIPSKICYCYFIGSVTGWITLVKYIFLLLPADVAPHRAHPFVCHSHPGITVALAGLSLTFSFPDHTQLLSSTNCRLIDLLSSTMSWGINCSTNWANLLGLLWRDSSWGKYVRFVLTTGGFLPAVFPTFFLANYLAFWLALYLQWICQSPPNCLSPQPVLSGRNFTLLQIKLVPFGRDSELTVISSACSSGQSSWAWFWCWGQRQQHASFWVTPPWELNWRGQGSSRPRTPQLASPRVEPVSHQPGRVQLGP